MRKNHLTKLCIYSAFFASFSLNVNAQVHTGNLELNTQADVDAFNFTEVTGVLFIGHPLFGNITNLDGLSELTEVGASIILQNTDITNVNGLSNVTSIGASSATSNAISISNNDLLTNLDGLSNLTQVKRINIRNNAVLTSIAGLSGITGIIVDIIIEGNALLTNLDGLSTITTLQGNLTLKDNPFLANVDGLSGLLAVGETFEINNCPALTSLNGMTSMVNPGQIRFLSTGLTDLDAFSNVNFDLDGLALISNHDLTNIDGLAKIQEIHGGVFIELNSDLLNLDGLAKLTKVEGRFWITRNHKITDLDGLSKLEEVEIDVKITSNSQLVDFCGLTKLFTTGSIGDEVDITDNGANTVSIAAPPDITLNNDPGLCSRDITAVVPTPATVSGCLSPSPPSRSDYPPGNIFPVGTTNIIWSVTDGAGNTATAIQQVIITDNEAPAITCPAAVNVQCAADVPTVNIASVTASDNCSVNGVTHIADVISNQTCANRFTLTRTYKATDGSGNTAVCSQTITVNDNVSPQITGLSASKQILAPPNHKMQDITVNYNVIDNCDNNFTFNVNSNESVNGTGDGDTDPDWEVVNEHAIRLRAERAATGTGRVYTITVTANDGCNASVSSSVQVVVAHNVTGPHSGQSFKIGSAVSFTGEFWDVPMNKHTAKWLIDGNTTAKATVTEPSGAKNGKVSGSYKFTSPGVYKLQMNVTDQNGVTTYANTNGDLEAIVVIYDPNGGHTYGGGYFDSPAGALTSNPATTGKASYGFAMNYFKNSTYPKGETQFEFKVGDFEFNALNFDYLVISNSMAQFKGTGKIIGGQSGVGFTMTVTDGQLDGSGIDKIRMKIYNKNNGAIIYDNQPGASDAALPVQAVGTNSTVVISGGNSSLTSANTRSKGEMETKAPEVSNALDVIAFPNPSANNFTINVKANSIKEKITMRVVDMYGRIIETRNVSANSMLRFGERYRPGTYVVRIIQGKEQKEIKLIKLSD